MGMSKKIELAIHQEPRALLSTPDYFEDGGVNL
jgi:hypothetical protein